MLFELQCVLQKVVEKVPGHHFQRQCPVAFIYLFSTKENQNHSGSDKEQTTTGQLQT